VTVQVTADWKLYDAAAQASDRGMHREGAKYFRAWLDSMSAEEHKLYLRNVLERPRERREVLETSKEAAQVFELLQGEGGRRSFRKSPLLTPAVDELRDLGLVEAERSDFRESCMLRLLPAAENKVLVGRWGRT